MRTSRPAMLSWSGQANSVRPSVYNHIVIMVTNEMINQIPDIFSRHQVHLVLL